MIGLNSHCIMAVRYTSSFYRVIKLDAAFYLFSNATGKLFYVVAHVYTLMPSLHHVLKLKCLHCIIIIVVVITTLPNV